MRFKAFEKAISEINKLSLPGIETQLKMAPLISKQLMERYKEERNPQNWRLFWHYFTLVKTGETLLVLILRKSIKGCILHKLDFQEENQSLKMCRWKQQPLTRDLGRDWCFFRKNYESCAN